MTTLAVPGQASVCFSCGQPLPKDVASLPRAADVGPGEPALPAGHPPVPAVPSFPLTSAHEQVPLVPPANPYGVVPTAATIVGAAGQFAIRGGVEVRVGRDPAACPITLTEPRVSGIHATLKFEGGQLYAKDESSNNGTYVAGSRIPPQSWVVVPAGATIRFGPVEFTVKVD